MQNDDSLSAAEPTADADEFAEADQSEEQSRAAPVRRARGTPDIRKKQRELQRLKKELPQWRAKRDAYGRKKNTCFVVMIVALGDDFVDVVAALISAGILPTVTFPIPGLIRAMVAVHEPEPKPEPLLRSIAAMTIEAIPIVNLLPTTTINLLLDLLDAINEEEHAKGEVEKREQRIEKLQAEIRGQHRTPPTVIRSLAAA